MICCHVYVQCTHLSTGTERCAAHATHIPMKIDHGESRHFCADPTCPDPVWKPVHQQESETSRRAPPRGPSGARRHPNGRAPRTPHHPVSVSDRARAGGVLARARLSTEYPQALSGAVAPNRLPALGSGSLAPCSRDAERGKKRSGTRVGPAERVLRPAGIELCSCRQF